MKCNAPRISGPYSHDNLTVFLIHGSSRADTRRYAVLKQALQQKKVVVHETGTVGELLIENLMQDKDVFIQAGEILRGGRQDRTIRVDLVVPARTKIPFPTYCVESARWHRRGRESAESFSSSDHYLATKHLKLAAKLHASQAAVWNKVAEAQAKLSESIGAPVYSQISSSSLELALDHDQLVRRRQDYIQKLQSLVADHPDSTGFVFAINGRLNSAETYASHDLFAAFWPKLLESAAVEAVAEQRKTTDQPPPVTAEEVCRFLTDADNAPSKTQSITDRVTVHTKQTAKSILFETDDRVLPEAHLHRQYIWDPYEPQPQTPFAPDDPHQTPLEHLSRQLHGNNQVIFSLKTTEPKKHTKPHKQPKQTTP